MAILLQPSRCTADLPVDLDAEHLVAEIKLDGSRYMMYIQCDPYGRQSNNALLSRRISSVDSKNVDKTDNVPQITSPVYTGLEGTVLDGEMFLKDFPTTQSVMGSGSALAQAKQKDIGQLNYFVFDVPVFRGVDIRGRPLSERRKVLETVVARLNNPNIKCVPQWRGDIEENFRKVVSAGGEGLIVKDLRMGYGTGWAKMKKSYDTSCVVTGFKPGNGKYTGMVGALAVSVFDENGKLKEVGYASGFSDEIRREMTHNWEKFNGAVVDIYAQELSKDCRLRHPTFFRFREDLEPNVCTLEKLKADLSKKLKSKRFREG